MSESEKAEKKESPKKSTGQKGPCAVCPMKCKQPICLVIIVGLVIWFVVKSFI